MAVAAGKKAATADNLGDSLSRSAAHPAVNYAADRTSRHMKLSNVDNRLDVDIDADGATLSSCIE
jgi:hypothetical protein